MSKYHMTEDDNPWYDITIDTNENLRVYAEEYCAEATEQGNYSRDVAILNQSESKNFTLMGFIQEVYSTPKAILLCLDIKESIAFEQWFPKSVLRNLDYDFNTVYVLNYFITNNPKLKALVSGE